MITRRDLLTVSAVSVAFSATGLVPPAIAQPLAKTAHILTGFTPGLQDAMARLIAGQMKDYAQNYCRRDPAGCGRPGRGGGREDR